MTRRFHPWERPGTRCSSGPQPGAQAFLAAVLDVFGDHGARSLGIYNCRTVRGSSTPSVHGEGRAIDVGLPMDGAAADGHQVVDRILAVAWELGLCYAVYDRTDFNQSHPWGDTYGGTHPHRDHLHAELTWHAARNLNYVTARSLLEDRPVKKLAQVTVAPSADRNAPDVNYAEVIAAGYDLFRTASRADGTLHSLIDTPDVKVGDRVEVEDFYVAVGGKTKVPPGVAGVRVFGSDRQETAQAVFDFIREHDPEEWKRRGRPY